MNLLNFFMLVVVVQLFSSFHAHPWLNVRSLRSSISKLFVSSFHPISLILYSLILLPLLGHLFSGNHQHPFLIPTKSVPLLLGMIPYTIDDTEITPILMSHHLEFVQSS